MEGTAMDKMFPNKEAGERVEKDSTFCDHFTPSFCKNPNVTKNNMSYLYY